jgi:Spy/CpxP family protein refolding chaperone
MATKLIVITGFLVSFAAGMMVGVRQRIETAKPATFAMNVPTTGPSTGPFGSGRGRGPRTASSMIVRELGLSPDQTQKMNTIFHKTAEVGHDLDEQRRNLRQKRDDDIRALAQAEQNDKYVKILKDYNDASERITEEWRTTYTSAVDQTKEILRDDQRKQYEEILTRNHWDGRGGDWPWPWGPGDRGGRGGPPGGGRMGLREGERRSNPQSQQDNRSENNGRSGLDSATTRPGL